MAGNTNWAGNLAYSAAEVAQPASEPELARLLADSTGPVKALGTRHCFNDVADTNGTQVSLRNMNKPLRIDEAEAEVTVQAGIRYGDLAQWLNDRGWALANLASLPHITVAGAVMTATHGSGLSNACLSAAIKALRIVGATGEPFELKRGDDDFPGAVVSLGALGIVSEMTLAIEPTFDVRQTVYGDLPFATVIEQFPEVMSAGYSVSLFTNWRDHFHQAWLKARTEEGDPPETFFGAKPAEKPLHPLPDETGVNCTAQFGEPGPWHERLPHFRLAFEPSKGEEIQAEYFVPVAEAPGAIKAMMGIGDQLRDVIKVSEVRTGAPDDLWLSPFSRGAQVCFHFTFRRDPDGVAKILPTIESALAPFNPLPHWGKVFAMDSETVSAGYPRIDEFRALARRFDPNGRFRNAYLDRVIFPA